MKTEFTEVSETRKNLSFEVPAEVLNAGRKVAILALASPPEQQATLKLEDIEQYRLQMAGISTAAIGYWKEGDGIHPDYDTTALRDVARLYAKYDALFQQAAAEPKAEPAADFNES